jgi:hypothetical protein
MMAGGMRMKKGCRPTKRIKRVLVAAAVGFVLTSGLIFTEYGEGADTSGWADLVSGNDLTGWILRGGIAEFKAADGVITARTPLEESRTSTFLCTEKTYGDFELEFEARIDAGFNSGVQIRSGLMTEVDAEAMTKSMAAGMANIAGGPGDSPGDQAGAPPEMFPPEGRGGSGAPMFQAGTVFGPQIEIVPADDSGASNSGFIFGEGMPKGWLTDSSRLVAHRNFKNDQWNQFRVLAQGPRIRIWINGVLVEDLTDEETFRSHPKGFIGLQCHFIPAGTGPYECGWRNIRIRALD